MVAARKTPSSKEAPSDPGSAVNTPDNQTKEGRQGGAINAPAKEKKTATPAQPAAAKVDVAEVQKLLSKHTCSACHKTNERSVGPAFTEIAKRKYSNQKIVSLVHNPQPQNWPDYTPMAPMPHVPAKDIEKIASWINS